MATLFLTGGNRGIGLAILKRFATAGYDIVVSTRKKYDEFEQQCRDLETENHISIHQVYMELDNPESIAQGLKDFDALSIVPDVVVNNAGMFHEKLLMFSKLEDIRTTFQVNYFSVIQISQYMAKKMMRTGGSIVNISSISADVKHPLATGYGASKAALNRFTTSLAQELAAFRIRVNAVSVGIAKTDMIDALNEKSSAAMIASTSMKRMADPTEIANAVFYLSSDQASFVNGQILRVDGGLSM